MPGQAAPTVPAMLQVASGAHATERGTLRQEKSVWVVHGQPIAKMAYSHECGALR